MCRQIVSRALIVVTFVCSLVAIAPAVQARGREQALVGKVSLRRAALPGRKGTAAYLAQLRRSSAGRAIFREDERTGEWTIHYAAVAARPVHAVRVVIYDISRGARLLGSHDQILYKRSRILAGTLKLARDQIFSPNARLRIVFETLGGRMLAHRPFYIQGRELVHRRKRLTSVDFSGGGGRDEGGITMSALEDARRRRHR